MSDRFGTPSSPAQLPLPLDAARARARRLREEAIRDFGAGLRATVAAAARRLARSLRPAGAARPPVRRAAHPAR